LSIDTLLRELVSTIEGATGAILLEGDGEAVQWHSPNAERLRLRGAYVAVAFKACRATAVREKLGGLSCLTLAYDGAGFVAQEIDRDCFVLLELNPTVNVGQALFRIKPVVEKLRYEIER
jgi:predicted regulator of Ras-like GTPase activity (Roadblock/LC7/MglB family)